VKVFLAFYESKTNIAAMRIAAPISSIRAVALLPRAHVGHGREEGATVPAITQLAVTPVQATAAYLAQTIAQELMGEPLPPAYNLADAYLPRPSAAFEGLNFRTVA
jgi:hypothetical protein